MEVKDLNSVIFPINEKNEPYKQYFIEQSYNNFLYTKSG